MTRIRNTFTVTFVAALLAAPLASARHEPATPTKQELRAMMLRGEALDRIYHLGTAASSAQYVRAQRVRGLALDRVYHLGPYARTSGNSFQWRNVVIGASAAFAAIVAGLGAAIARRRRRTPLPA